jgi:hypothetical protein
MKKEVKEEILKEVRAEMNENFEKMKKWYDDSFNINKYLQDDTILNENMDMSSFHY